ncbi:hypothetical protein DL239_10685 [Sedimentitalea sp. CY04]|uniref:Uncharacterized protein n=1 Tax=Parasedimentitalea denitrificans TaxID=2211118 RepID=A0ABX0W7A1_9RHOB|nr:hypothetical protein [Sedimentitalea sp. CY04]NIZ61442.1 hypothetical protein [Sedimentitalea sp. CY04]
MLSYSSDTGWVFDPLQCGLVIAIIAFSVYRNQVRRKSLHKRDDGLYVWVEWYGGERCSATDPSVPGGLWDSEADDGGDGGD